MAGELLLAASTIPGEHLLPSLLSSFCRRYPNIRVKAVAGDSTSVMAQVERGEASLGLVGRKADGPNLEPGSSPETAWCWSSPPTMPGAAGSG